MPIKSRLGPCPTCGTPRKVAHYAGADLRKVREGSGLSIRRLAETGGLSASYISDVELGRRRATPAVVALYESLRPEGGGRG